jgi:hypothetical protein
MVSMTPLIRLINGAMFIGWLQRPRGRLITVHQGSEQRAIGFALRMANRARFVEVPYCLLLKPRKIALATLKLMNDAVISVVQLGPDQTTKPMQKIAAIADRRP